MRDFIVGAIIALVLGCYVGAVIAREIDRKELADAWEGVTVIQDGTLVANPTYYAYHPTELANAKIVDNREAAIDYATRN